MKFANNVGMVERMRLAAGSEEGEKGGGGQQNLAASLP